MGGNEVEVLSRLVDKLRSEPLRPITRADFDNVLADEVGKSVVQCPRFTSLFMKHDDNGNIYFSDINRVECTNGDGVKWYSGTVLKVIDELFPITLPYTPTKERYLVTVKEYRSDACTSDYDGMWLKEVKTPEGKIIPLNLYYIEDDDDDKHGMIRVSAKVFLNWKYWLNAQEV